MTTLTIDTIRGSADPADPPLSRVEKLVIGGVGGMTPILATLVGGEIDRLPAQLLAPEGVYYYVGLLARAVLFFTVGAVFVWLHGDVRTRYAVFRLGIAAPAILAAGMGSSAQAGAPDARMTAAVGGAEIRLALHEDTGARAALSDALPPGIVFGKCTVVDGLLGRKCR